MTDKVQALKQRFGIIGNSDSLNRALLIASQVAVTDMSVLVTGESGVGKEVFSKIIHQLSPRKHYKYIAVNCGAIPEGTIESELFGHVKGAFTNADRDRKGYFAEADKGTIFLDEVADLPLAMQVKLLRVLESGEFLPVGSSTLQKVNVRIVAATNVDLPEAIKKGKLREDLYYRLNQISIAVPSLRERKEDISLLWRKFASDQSERYRMPIADLDEEAKAYAIAYPWYGNIRQLKNVAEQISIVETQRPISKQTLENYIPMKEVQTLPAIWTGGEIESLSERELLLKALSVNKLINDMRAEINDLRLIINTLVHSSASPLAQSNPVGGDSLTPYPIILPESFSGTDIPSNNDDVIEHDEVKEPSLSLSERERNAIEQALHRSKGKRKQAAKELGISERTLYRKIKEYDLD